ncbi:hypothetical protein AB0442_26230 [Kitasatospora sp. NPDC085895]|uniref:hypothetical protein n=1 Tax=Kitasatospora sp. NPDC085895 TaxID=3155057 RepID=UPI00344D341E
MSADPQSDFPLTLSLLHELLGTDPGDGVRPLLAASRQVRGVLAPLVLSLAAREGVPMGTGSRGELDRMLRRAAHYRELVALVGTVEGLRVMKGPSLARYYPGGLLRPPGDLDLVVPDEAALWQAVALLGGRQSFEGAVYTELRQDAVDHRFVGLWWYGEDPLLDHEAEVEVATFAFAGEPGIVPVRAALPADQVHADLLALAEERFQRPFTVRDSIDLAVVLGSPLAPAAGPLADSAAAHCLAPELLELCELTAGRPGLGETVPAALTDALREPAAAERHRRAALPAPADLPESAGGAEDRLAAGRTIHGLQLTALRDGVPRAAVHHRFDGGLISRTPVADFLMVTGELVDPACHARALDELDRLDPWPAAAGTGGR